jgi:hypothetical protein
MRAVRSGASSTDARAPTPRPGRREAEEVGDGQHVIDHVVELFGECVDVLTVEGSDEGRVETLEDLVGQLIAPTLAVDHQVVLGFEVREIHDHVAEPPGALRGVHRRLVEERKEPVVRRQPSESEQDARSPQSGPVAR